MKTQLSLFSSKLEYSGELAPFQSLAFEQFPSKNTTNRTSENKIEGEGDSRV